MDRRIFLGTLAGGFLSASLATRAQPAGKVFRIGLFLTGALSDPNVDALRDGLRELGYVEGQNLTLESRSAQETSDRLPRLAAELVGLRVDVIVAQGTALALAAKRATATIPIVTAYSGDPVRTGLVATLARPGGNVTGLAALFPELSAKRLGLLKEVFPKATRVGALVFVPSSDPMRAESWKALQDAARALGLTLLPIEATSPDQYRNAFTESTRVPTPVLTLGDALLDPRQRIQIVTLAAEHRVPVMYGIKEFADAGGLVAYGPSFPAMHRRAATYIDKILKGAKPGDLPIEQPTKFELVINLKTAKALGLTIPQSLLRRADQVIE
jgi:putative ABC transport system substrate-binding protein